MATLQSSIQLFDGFSKPLNNIISSVNMTINTLRTLNNTNVKINTKNLNEASKLIAIAQNDLTNIQNSINNNIDAQNRFNRSLGEGERKSENLLKSVGRMVAAYASFQTLKTGINLSDRLTQTTARLNLMNDGKQTTEELQQMIFQSAKNSRGSFLDLAQTVSKLGILAPNAFKSNAEAVAFTELMTKSFKIGGASGQEQSAGMYQLTQALASGRLQGDEFRSIMENAPMLAQAISNYVGVGMGDLRQLSSEGKLTAEIIKNAMFN